MRIDYIIYSPIFLSLISTNKKSIDMSESQNNQAGTPLNNAASFVGVPSEMQGVIQNPPQGQVPPPSHSFVDNQFGQTTTNHYNPGMYNPVQYHPSYPSHMMMNQNYNNPMSQLQYNPINPMPNNGIWTYNSYLKCIMHNANKCPTCSNYSTHL